MVVTLPWSHGCQSQILRLKGFFLFSIPQKEKFFLPSPHPLPGKEGSKSRIIKAYNLYATRMVKISQWQNLSIIFTTQTAQTGDKS